MPPNDNPTRRPGTSRKVYSHNTVFPTKRFALPAPFAQVSICGLDEPWCGAPDAEATLRELGVNTLYLTPIFLAASNHKYDTADYRHVGSAAANGVAGGSGTLSYKNDFIDIDAAGTVTTFNLANYLKFVAKQARLKAVPSFDQVAQTPALAATATADTTKAGAVVFGNYSGGESNLFGTAAQINLGGKPNRLVLGGRSMGGRMCSMAVADGLPAAGLVLICYPLHPPGAPLPQGYPSVWSTNPLQ